MADIFTSSDIPLSDPGANWCPDCGEPRGVCACEAMRANNPNEELDDWLIDEDDDNQVDLVCPHCNGTGGNRGDDGVTPCDFCDGEGFQYWL